MHVLLQALERDGSVVRPAVAPVGRALPAELTPLGRERLAAASAAVRGVEDRMRAGLDEAEVVQLAALLDRCVEGLQGGATSIEG